MVRLAACPSAQSICRSIKLTSSGIQAGSASLGASSLRQTTSPWLAIRPSAHRKVSSTTPLHASNSASRSFSSSRAIFSVEAASAEIDYELFHKPGDREGHWDTAFEHYASYDRPAVANILQMILLPGRSEPDVGLTPKQVEEALVQSGIPDIDPVAEANAAGELEKILALGETIGTESSSGLFEAAARVALKHRGCEAAIPWLQVCQRLTADDTHTDQRRKQARRFLKALLLNIRHDTAGCQRVLDVVIEKGWHSEAALHRPLLGLVKSFYNRSLANGGVQMLLSSIMAKSVQLSPANRGGNQHRFLANCHNAAIHALVLSYKNAEALDLIKALTVVDNQWSPPLGLFTYGLFMEKVLMAAKMKDIAVAAQEHLKLLADKISNSTNLFQGQRYAVWTNGHVQRLLTTGRMWLEDYDHKYSVTTTSDSEQKVLPHGDDLTNDEQLYSVIRPGQESPLAMQITHLLRAGRLSDARTAFLESVQQGNYGLWEDRCHSLALYQDALDDHSEHRGLITEAPRDAEVEAALGRFAGAHGLWEFTHLWRMTKRGDFGSACQYYLTTFRPVDWVPDAMVMHALGAEQCPDLSLHLRQVACHRKTHLVHIISQAVIGAICQRFHAHGLNSFQMVQITKQRLDHLVPCYDSLLTALNQSIKGQASIDVASLTSRLESRFEGSAKVFNPWIRAFSSHYDHLVSWNECASPTESEITILVSSLHIFKSVDLDSIPSIQMSAATFKCLKVLLDMQNLNVRPDKYTLSWILRTLATDAYQAWYLLEHLAQQLGLLHHESGRMVHLDTYVAILEGLVAIRGRGGGLELSLPYFYTVRDWLDQKTVSGLGEGDQDRGKLTIDELDGHSRLNEIFVIFERIEQQKVLHRGE
ncbi:unnamed protein product [Sympodiomycopsis kandeliae]